VVDVEGPTGGDGTSAQGEHVNDVRLPRLSGTGDLQVTYDDCGSIWHVTLTVSGTPVPLSELRAGLERLHQERPFLLSARYAEDHAEVRYWEEARDVDDAAALALRLWGEHRRTAALPPWKVVGLEVVDRITYQRRAVHGEPTPALVPAGGVRPF
jgi:hypothetical protein